MANEIHLRASHLIVAADLAKTVLGDSHSAYVSYKEAQQFLLLSPSTNAWFPKLHESREYMVKAKDLKGTKSIAIREILIDLELEDQDRPLAFEANYDKRFIRITL